MQSVANSLAVGFASVGKLTGAAANMFQDMLGKFYSDSLDELDFDFDSKEPDDIFYGASKHMFLSVLAEVAVGC